MVRVLAAALAVATALGAVFALGRRATAQAAVSEHFNGARALEYTRQFVAIGPRWVGSPGHQRAEAFLKQQFAHDRLEEDTFTTDTPIGPQTLHNFIVRFPGRKPGVIVLASHYETNYPLRSIGFVGANDGGSSTGLLLELANHLRGHELEGHSVWLVFFDGEEAFDQWSRSDSLYGSRHLAAKWQTDGTLRQLRAFLLADMIGDKDLEIDRDRNSTPWLLDLVYKAAKQLGVQSHFFVRENQVEDDHLPFVQRGVPCADMIDINYGPNDRYHHTAEDTMDKLSARSLTITGDVLLATIRLLNQQ